MALMQKSVRRDFWLLMFIIVGAFVGVPALLLQVEPAVGMTTPPTPAVGTKIVLQEDYAALYAGTKPAGNGDRIFSFCDECWIQHDGTLTVLCSDSGGVLASYGRPKDDSFGSLCPVSVNVYIDAPLWQRLQDEKGWLARTKAAMARLSKTCDK